MKAFVLVDVALRVICKLKLFYVCNSLNVGDLRQKLPRYAPLRCVQSTYLVGGLL